MESTSSIKDESTKKRPSKGFRACWECKRRKTHGNWSAEGDQSGLGSTSDGSHDDDHVCNLHLGERFSKLEQLFDKFVCRKFVHVGEGQSTISRTPIVAERATEKPSKYVLGLPDLLSDTQSISSIGDGILASQHHSWTSTPSIRPIVDSSQGSHSPGSESVRKSLVVLLPSQHDANVIFESTNGWMVLQTGYKPTRDLFVDRDPETYALDMSAVAQAPTIIIARTLLHLAICINGLPPEFDCARLADIWSLDATMQNYVTTVTSLVTSADEQLSTLPGLETLLLLAFYHLISASLRQAWLIIRRAMNLTQLMGFHRIIEQPTLSPPIEVIEAAKFLWRSLIDGDRYLCLHLRLPFASDQYPYPKGADPHVVHRYEIGLLCQQVAELDRSVTPQTYVQALALDERLEFLMKSLPKDFWEVPNVPSTVRSPESGVILERLIGQIWHFELKIFIHLPFLLRAAQESRYEYSKLTALQASRNVIMRWFALRNSNITQACCRLAELGVFIGTVTLGLDILIDMGTKEKAEVQRTRGNDFCMICRVVGEMDKLAKASPREKFAARSAVIIRKILCSLDPSRRTAQKVRLTLPYFGTIELEYHKAPVRPTFDLDSDTAKKLNSSTKGTHPPIFSFVSNELWPTPEQDWAQDLNFDMVLFDGLEDQDTDGNWVF